MVERDVACFAVDCVARPKVRMKRHYPSQRVDSGGTN